MKKIALILLIGIYATSIGAVGIKEFYCCGKLTSVSVALTVTNKDTCKKGDFSDYCCKTKYQYFKVKDTHLLGGELSSLVTHPAVLPSFPPSYEDISSISREADNINGSHAPPLPGSVPIYIFNCIFRV